MEAIFPHSRVSERKYGILFDRDVKVPMRDGIKLSVNISRPDAKGKFPALVGLAPIHMAFQDEHIWPAAARSTRIHGSPGVNIDSPPRDFFVPRGYVKIVGNSRGTGRSEGIFRIAGPEEVLDQYDLIEWTARQPWCNGNIGMSCIGEFTAMEPQVAAMQPTHLKAIAPLFPRWDAYRNFWWTGGILANGFLKWVNNLINNDVHTERCVLLDELGEKKFKQVLARALADKDIAADPGLVEILKNPFALSHASMLDILLHPLIDSFWKERGSKIDFDKIKVPCYFGVVSHRPGPMIDWERLKMPKKMVYVPPAYIDRPFYQMSWELLRWFDYWLKGIDSGIMDEPNIRIFVPGSNEWLNASDFPIPCTKWIPFNLHENRSLCEIEPWPEAESDSYDDAPGNRGNLKYYSAPFVENTEMVGLASLNVYASCRGTDMNLFASLWVADREGKESCLCRGYLKASHRELDPELSKPWHPVTKDKKLEPVIPGQVYNMAIGFSPLAYYFKAGERLVLKISSADDDPENLFQVGMYHLCSQTPNTITIYHDAGHPSHLLLPITKGNIIGTYVSGGDISLKNKEFMKLK